MLDILLIDDDEKLAPLLKEYCARYDINITAAAKPSIGFDKLKAHHFDAVILDIMLPDMDGFDVCRTIRKTSEIPIIMLTARIELGSTRYIMSWLIDAIPNSVAA